MQALHPGIIELHVLADESRDDTPRLVREPVVHQPPGALRQDVNHEEDYSAESDLERHRETPLRLVREKGRPVADPIRRSDAADADPIEDAGIPSSVVGWAALGLVDRHARRKHPNANACDAAPDDELGHGVGRALDDDAEELHVNAPVESPSPAEPVTHEDHSDAADERCQLVYGHDCALHAGAWVVEGLAKFVVGTYQVCHDALVVAKEREAHGADHGNEVHQQLALQTALESGPERRHLANVEHFPKCADQ